MKIIPHLVHKFDDYSNFLEFFDLPYYYNIGIMTIHLLWIFLVLLIFHIYTRYNRRGRLLRNIPGLTAYPILGNLLAVCRKNELQLWEEARLNAKKYYPITRYYGIESAFISCGHPDDLEVLLSSNNVIEKGYAYRFIEPWLKTGLLTSAGDKWRQRRKILTPAFHFGILKKYMEITSEQGENLIKTLESEGEEIVKSLIPFCSNYTLNIICESTMGVTLDKMDNETVNLYKKSIHNMGKIVLYRLIRPYIPSWLLPYISKEGSLQSVSLRILHHFTNQIIKERREYHSITNNKYLNEYTDDVEDTVYNDFDIGRKRRMTMLDLLLSAEKNGLIDDEGIREEVDTFTFEGHDTTSMAMTYTLLLLAENKEAQDRARNEVTSVLNGSGRKMGIQEVQEFPYLERCIKESIRLFPPVPTLMRYTSEELQLKHALVPADSHIMIHIWDAHRDPNFWYEPNKFSPDRFLPENTKNRHTYAYVPFSAGPRNCIGQKFALIELKSLIGQILFNYYLEPVNQTSDMKFIADIILRPSDPVHIKFIKINK